jgi:3'(2'), 5'-bisphosphate nucleotidase
MSLSPLLTTLTEIARAAGNVVLSCYRETVSVEYKGPNDPVTSADKAANTLICQALSAAFPGWPIVAEESDPDTFGDYRSAECGFFVDPIDGTREFLERTDEFVVMIGLVRGQRASAGVIHAPTSGLFWAGELGKSAYQLTTTTEARRIAPSQTSELAQSQILISRAHRSARLSERLEAIQPKAVRSVGSAGLKGAFVAEGAADAYLAIGMAGKRWDACALDAIVTSAGGCVTDTTGERINYRADDLANKSGLVVSNGNLHAPLLAKLTV